MEPLKLFEAFAGYGGASFALKKSNIPFVCVGYSEIDKYASKLYDQNFKNVKNYGDITKIDAYALPDFDILTGGFPCQDISTAGSMNLSKNRSALVFDLLKIAKAKQPKYILLENVGNILSKRYEDFLNSILKTLNDIGYKVEYKALNSKDYGMPQNRKRVWFVCIRKDIPWNFKWVFEDDDTIKIEQILETDFPDKYYMSENWNRWYNSDSGKKRIKMGFITLNKPIANCLTARQYASWGGNFMKDENGIRKLTPTECFRLMGFMNDEININGISNAQLYKMTGNGWDINVVSKIFKNLLFLETYI